MKKLFGFLVLLVLFSCGKTSFNAELGEAFNLTSEQSVKITQTELKFDGFKVIEDSRCPKNVNCIWEGQVIAEFVMNGESLKINSFKTLDTLGYTFKINSVEPMKEDGVEIPLADYILEILVSK